MSFITQITPPQLTHEVDIVAVAAEFNIEEYDPTLFSTMNVKFPTSLKNSVKKRQAEFLAGRSVAKSALVQLGITNFDIEIGDNRQPLWPANILGSITHTNHTACCVLSTKDKLLGLGIDTEYMLDATTAKDIAKNILTEKEANILTLNDYNFTESCTLAFSAKESLFKALYSRVNQYFDFLDVEIVNISSASNCLTFKVLKKLSSTIKQGMKFDCFYELCNDKVHTLTFQPK
jgi:enterobactin synthetase component D